MKQKKLSLLIILGIYIIATASAAICAYYLHIGNALLEVLVADIAATFVVFIFSIIFKNASVYDAYWSVAPPIIIVGYYAKAGADFNPLHLIVIIPLVLWSIRLTYNWCLTFDNLKWQDWRYLRFKEKFPTMYILINLVGIMLMPTLVVFAGTIPLYYLIQGQPNLLTLMAGGTIILFAVIYQATADSQMRSFRADQQNKGRCIDIGLWKYSRHPNYFAEIMTWVGVFVASLSNFKPISILGPLVMIVLFSIISVPLMEGRLLKTRTEYADYKKTVTSSLVPFVRKRQG